MSKAINSFELVGSIDDLTSFIKDHPGYMFCLHPLEDGNYRLSVLRKDPYCFWRFVKKNELV